MGISNVSNGLRSGVCTSSTRPTAPYEGQVIYETDTDRVLVWNGSAWYANWNTAWGTVGHVTTSPNQTVTTVTDMTGVTVTFTAVSGRRYKSTIQLEMYNQNANSLVDIALADAASSNLRGWTVQMKDSGLQTPFSFTWVESSLSGSVTRKVRFGRGFGNTGNVISFSSQQLTVEDIGPA
jgi:ribosomal protein S11